MNQDNPTVSFADRNVLVTGAASGMGRSHAENFAQQGATVVVQDLNEAGAAETVATIIRAGGRAVALAFDVAQPDIARGALARVQAEIGGIDILINNAGIFDEYTTDQIDPAIFWRMINVHVRGAFVVTQAVIDGMKAKTGGRIINISSNWGLVGHHVSPHYCAAKAAVLGLMKSWALEFAPWKITVNAIASGGVLTEMVMRQHNIEQTLPHRFSLVPLGRYARPQEMSNVVSFLASPEAGFITGQTINVSGGETIVGI